MPLQIMSAIFGTVSVGNLAYRQCYLKSKTLLQNKFQSMDYLKCAAVYNFGHPTGRQHSY